MNKKILALTLALCLISSFIFTGCSPKKNQEASTDIKETNKDVALKTEETVHSEPFKNGILIINGVSYNTLFSPKGELSIVKRPLAAVINPNHYGAITDLSILEPTEEIFGIDLRATDLSKLDLTNEMYKLQRVTFNSQTKWPVKMPKGFEINKIMDYGKDPGLNVKEIHKGGITGKGIGIAIIDQALLVDHIEYKDQLKLYEEIHCADETAQMHGPAVASIAVGKNVGVAPGATLYYIARTSAKFENNNQKQYDYTVEANCIDRIIEINRSLPEDEKIRVISISLGFTSNVKGYAEFQEAVNRAAKENIYTITVDEEFSGANRDILSDPNEFSSYQKGLFYSKGDDLGGTVLFPMDSRCAASPDGPTDYTFYRDGGMSWVVPYVAGLYALACEAKPSITPSEFIKEIKSTKKLIEIDVFGEKKKAGIVDPIALIEKIKNQK